MSIPTIAEASALIAAKKLSPVELMKACLARLHATEDTIHAFVLPTEERALGDAQSGRGGNHAGRTAWADAWHSDRPEGHCRYRGSATTCGSAILQDNVPTTDAACAAALTAAGTVLMGKLTTHEFADGGPSFDLPKPPARNPWNPDHFTAGSSSGTGAGVAAGMISAASERIPADRSAGRLRYVAIAGLSQPTGWCRAPASPPLPSAWTTSGRWRGPRRTARSCCRFSRATIRPILPVRSANSGLPSGADRGAEGRPRRRDPAFPRDGLSGGACDPGRHRYGDDGFSFAWRYDRGGNGVAVAGLACLRFTDLHRRARRRL